MEALLFLLFSAGYWLLGLAQQLVVRLKKHEVNEETESDHHRFHSDIEIHGKLDSKVVCISKGFPKKPCPLLTDLTDADFIHSQNLKVHVWQAAPAAEWPLQLEDRLPVLVLDGELGQERMPLLEHITHNVPRGRLDLQLLQTAREEAGHALQWTVDRDHFLSKVVEDADGEGAQWAAALAGQTVVLLHGVEHVLTHHVTDLILIIAFKAGQSLYELHLLFNQQLIHLCEVF